MKNESPMSASNHSRAASAKALFQPNAIRISLFVWQLSSTIGTQMFTCPIIYQVSPYTPSSCIHD